MIKHPRLVPHPYNFAELAWGAIVQNRIRYKEALFPRAFLGLFLHDFQGTKEEVSQSQRSFPGSGKGEGKLWILANKLSEGQSIGFTGVTGHTILKAS